MTERSFLHESDRVATENQWGTASSVVRYEILTSCLHQDGVDHLTYGIQCLGNRKGDWVRMDAVADVSFQRDEVARLANLFNRLQLSPVHFRDALLDCVNA